MEPLPPHDELLHHAPCGLFSFSAKGMLVAVNDPLLEWLGYTRDELLSRPLATILTLAGRMFCETHVLPMLRMNGRVQELYLPLRAKSGESVPVLLNAVSQTHAEGTVHHCAVMSVRERGRYEDELLKAKRQAEEALRGNEALSQAQRELEERARALDQKLMELEQRNQDLTRVSTILAQDLREPARKLSMFACLFTREDREGLSLTGQRSLERIKTDSAKMEQLVAGLHQFMTLDTLEEPTEEVDLLEAVGNARRRTAEMRGPLQLRCDPLPVIEGRRRQLMMLFHNLFDNAAKFRRTEESPRIDIQCQLIQHNSFRAIKDKYHYTDFARIILADNGMGFDSQYKAYVFEVMRKLDAGTPGLGIGLPICRKVVESHQGTISVESVLGQGTRFTILLPLKQQVAPLA
ncbi:MAG: ATP-binding protein [Cystobacter sp.]